MAPTYRPPVPFSPNVFTNEAGMVYPAGGPFGGFQFAGKTLAATDVQNLLTLPITLIPAPGAGLILVPTVILIRVAGVTAAYTDAGGAVSFAIGSMSVSLAATTVFTGPTDGQQSQQIFLYTGTSTAAAPSTNVNAALTISKATNNFAAGSGTAHITVYYNTDTAT